jgi:hypothetical protein
MAGCAAAPPPAPPTPGLRVVLPSPGVPREHARFSGRWVGKWEGQLDRVMHADGFLVDEYWRGDKVTSRARLTPAPKGP